MISICFITDEYSAFGEWVEEVYNKQEDRRLNFKDFPFPVKSALNLDQRITEWIASKFPSDPTKPAYDGFVIKLSLSASYMDYIGLQLAYHLRLSQNEQLRCVPIILLADAPLNIVASTAQMPEILFTEGCYLLPDTVESYKRIAAFFAEGKFREISDYDKFLSRIHIPPPDNFGTHHSQANEWALARYTKILAEGGKTPEAELPYTIAKRESTYLKTLHFKYLQALSQTRDVSDEPEVLVLEIPGVKGKKIAIIDDEANKGWGSLYTYWLGGLNEMDVTVCDIAFNTPTQAGLLAELKRWIEKKIEEGVRLFLLDLRLHSDDAAESNPENLTGIKIAQFIKGINQGLQIIIATASNKVWNYKECQELGISDFSIKESPGDWSTTQGGVLFFNHTGESISAAAQKTYLYNVREKIKAIKLLSRNPLFKTNDADSMSVVRVTETALETGFILLNSEIPGKTGVRNKDFAYIQFYQLIEFFTKHSSNMEWSNSNKDERVLKSIDYTHQTLARKKDDGRYDSIIKYNYGLYIKGDDVLEEHRITEANYGVCAMLLFRYQQDKTATWKAINRIRNKEIAHDAKSNAATAERLEEVLDLICFLYDTKNMIYIQVASAKDNLKAKYPPKHSNKKKNL